MLLALYLSSHDVGHKSTKTPSTTASHSKKQGMTARQDLRMKQASEGIKKRGWPPPTIALQSLVACSMACWKRIRSGGGVREEEFSRVSLAQCEAYLSMCFSIASSTCPSPSSWYTTLCGRVEQIHTLIEKNTLTY